MSDIQQVTRFGLIDADGVLHCDASGRPFLYRTREAAESMFVRGEGIRAVTVTLTWLAPS